MPAFSIPKISNARLEELAARIKPVARGPGGVAFWVQPTAHPRNESYTYDIKFGKEALGLIGLVTIRTLHAFNYHGMFKPSIAEVLAQIPHDLIDKVGAFEIVVRPENASDLNLYRAELNAGFHVAETMLYEVEPNWPKFEFKRAYKKTRFDREDPV